MIRKGRKERKERKQRIERRINDRGGRQERKQRRVNVKLSDCVGAAFMNGINETEEGMRTIVIKVRVRIVKQRQTRICSC